MAGYFILSVLKCLIKDLGNIHGSFYKEGSSVVLGTEGSSTMKLSGADDETFALFCSHSDQARRIET